MGPSPTVTSHGEQPGGDRRHTEGQGGEFVPTLQSTRAPVLQRSLHFHVPAVGSSTGAWDTSQGRTQRRACSDVTVIHPAPHRSTLKAASLWVGASTHTVADETAVTAVTAAACTKHGAAQDTEHGAARVNCWHHTLGTEPSKDHSSPGQVPNDISLSHRHQNPMSSSWDASFSPPALRAQHCGADGLTETPRGAAAQMPGDSLKPPFPYPGATTGAYSCENTRDSYLLM